MFGLMGRLALLIGWGGLAWGAILTPSQSVPWVSGMVLPVAGAGFFWGSPSALALSWLSVAFCFILIFMGAPASLGIGPASLLFILPLVVWTRRREFLARRFGLDTQRLVFQQRSALLKRELERESSEVQAQEEKIHEISELYGLSKGLLATLDLDQVMQITEEAMSRWMPHLTLQQRTRCLQEIRLMIEQGAFSLETLVRSMPLAGSDVTIRERWGMVSGQLALGLQRVSLYRQVQELATHDGLTSLLVRRYFRHRLREEVTRSIRRGHPLVFLMVDLDHFKEVNDTFGHLVGDVVLREVAQRIQNTVREMDLVGRYGGEEFGVVLPDADQALGIQIADRIRQVIAERPIEAYDERVEMTVSIGVTTLFNEKIDADQLIDQADQAMYEAKAKGRNQTVSSKQSSVTPKRDT